MTHQRILEGLFRCLVLVCAICGTQPSQAWAQNISQEPTVGPTGPYLELDLPAPIEVNGVRRYGDILGLGEAQMNAIWGAHEKYQQAYRKLEGEAIAPLLEQSAQVALLSRTPLDAVSFKALMIDRKKILRRIARLDDLFFDEVFLQLAEDQTGLTEYVRLDRAREVYGFVFDTADIPQARNDLVELLLELQLPDKEKDAASPLIYAYLQAMVPLLKRRATTLISTRVKDKHLLGTLLELDGDNREQAIKVEAAVLDARRQLWRQPLNLSRRMGRVNVQFVRLYMAALPEETAARFLGRFKSRSYPEIYPDPSIAEPAILAVLRLDDLLSADQRDAIEAEVFTYRRSYQRICEKLEERITEWCEVLALYGALHVDEIKDHEDAMKELKLKRSRLSMNVIKTITTELLTPEQIEALPPVRSAPG